MVLFFLSFFFFFAWKKRSCSAVSGIRHLSLMVVRSRSIESVPSIVPSLFVVVFRGETLSPRLVAFRVVGSFCVFDGTLSLLFFVGTDCVFGVTSVSFSLGGSVCSFGLVLVGWLVGQSSSDDDADSPMVCQRFLVWILFLAVR